jgi:hypothetical protein
MRSGALDRQPTSAEITRRSAQINSLTSGSVLSARNAEADAVSVGAAKRPI